MIPGASRYPATVGDREAIAVVLDHAAARAALVDSQVLTGLAHLVFRGGDGAQELWEHNRDDVLATLESERSRSPLEIQAKTVEFMKRCALYHDVGKKFHKDNHPQLGANLMRHGSATDAEKLLGYLIQKGTKQDDHKYNRFALLVSVVQHHDKFGVVGTGEGGLSIFADIPYFGSDVMHLAGVKKNVTAVMLLNLADAAAVCPDKSVAVKKHWPHGRSRADLRAWLQGPGTLGLFGRPDTSPEPVQTGPGRVADRLGGFPLAELESRALTLTRERALVLS